MAKCEAFVGPQGSPIGVPLKKKEKEGEEKLEEEKRADGATPPLPSSLLSWDVIRRRLPWGTLERDAVCVRHGILQQSGMGRMTTQSFI